MKLLIIGAGKLGLPLAHALHTQGHSVTTLSKSPKQVADGITHLCQDVHNLSQDSLLGFDWVYVILSPSERSLVGYTHTYIDSIRPIVQAIGSQIDRLVYVSSTQVYGQNQGETITSTDTPCPISEQGKLLYAAELIWQAHFGDRLSIVRPSGIIDSTIYENFDGHFARLATTLTQDSPQMTEAYWLNLVYRQTLVALLSGLPSLPSPKNSYIASDICILRHEFYNRLRQAQGLDQIMVATRAKETGKKLVGDLV